MKRYTKEELEERLTGKVQYWRNDVMLTAMMDKKDAIDLVMNGSAFVITHQAIGDIRDLGK